MKGTCHSQFSVAFTSFYSKETTLTRLTLKEASWPVKSVPWGYFQLSPSRVAASTRSPPCVGLCRGCPFLSICVVTYHYCSPDRKPDATPIDHSEVPYSSENRTKMILNFDTIESSFPTTWNKTSSLVRSHPSCYAPPNNLRIIPFWFCVSLASRPSTYRVL